MAQNQSQACGERLAGRVACGEASRSKAMDTREVDTQLEALEKPPRQLERLVRWSEAADGAYAANTKRAWGADWRVFAAFCRSQNACPLPASAETVRNFVLKQGRIGKKPSTIRRYLATIRRAHRAAGTGDPCGSEEVLLAMREVAVRLGTEQKQARGLVWEEIRRFLAIEPSTLRDHRDRALVAVAYDTLCRSEELVALDREQLTLHPGDGSATVKIVRSKTDRTREGALVYLAPDTVSLLERWCKEAGIREGPLFRQVRGKQQLGPRLRPAAVGSVFKRLGMRIGLPPQEYERLSGHSTRVGATQDMLAHNIDIASVMQSGRWRDSRMVVRYGRHQLALRSGMARLARELGRVGPQPRVREEASGN